METDLLGNPLSLDAPPETLGGGLFTPDSPSLFGEEDNSAKALATIPEILPDSKPAYRVLARKYRPQTFDDVIGQEALVRTLTNAIHMDRVAHAFILTGVRGVGKTTTARIIARALNCTGADGLGGATPNPCGVCPSCVSIAADRNVDVIEMDAATNTGVDDIRTIIDGVRYKPVSSRYKIYIIDEVHMLSKNAFNALLKTLEEPPPHAKFLFATTEIHKVPVTVLSRCQRFDLRRISEDMLFQYFQKILKLESATATDDAVALIARAADGSVRDGLSLLDQALSSATINADGVRHIQTDSIRQMLGLADKAGLYDLFTHLHQGHVAESLDMAANLHAHGAEALVVAENLLELTHQVTKLHTLKQYGSGNRNTPKNMSDNLDLIMNVDGTELAILQNLADHLSMPVLSQTWQVLSEGYTEITRSPKPQAALEMVLLRLLYLGGTGSSPYPFLAILPQNASENPAANPSQSVPTNSPSSPPSPSSMTSVSEVASLEEIRQTPQLSNSEADYPKDFAALVEWCKAKGAYVLAGQLFHNVHLISYKPPQILVRLKPDSPADLLPNLSRLILQHFGVRWLISVADMGSTEGLPTLAEQETALASELRETAMAHPIVRAALQAFPDGRITKITEHQKPNSNTLQSPPAIQLAS